MMRSENRYIPFLQVYDRDNNPLKLEFLYFIGYFYRKEFSLWQKNIHMRN